VEEDCHSVSASSRTVAHLSRAWHAEVASGHVSDNAWLEARKIGRSQPVIADTSRRAEKAVG
jgi:hypothetical protein